MYEVHLHLAYRCEVEQRAVAAANDTEQYDAGHSDNETEALGTSRFETCDGAFLFSDIHCLHYEKIVVERNDGVDEGDKHEDVDGNAALVDGSGEDEELREEACKGRNTCEREHCQHHAECKAGIGLAEAAAAISISMRRLL